MLLDLASSVQRCMHYFGNFEKENSGQFVFSTVWLGSLDNEGEFGNVLYEHSKLWVVMLSRGRR